MSRKNILGEVRRSQVLGYGPGAIIDFRAGSADGGGPVSVVAPGLEFWDEYAGPPFPRTTQKIYEPRLESKLEVRGFRLPPVTLQKYGGKNDEDPKLALPGFRFPQWLQCPKCGTLNYASKWGKEPGDPTRWCITCTKKNNDKRVYVIPSRFVVACKKGHLDEFPWKYWLRKDPEKRAKCQGDKKCKLKLYNVGEGTGLSSLRIKCDTCGVSESMEGIFSEGALQGLTCNGSTPWLKKDNSECGETLRVLQRGASNLYMPIEMSALSIPPWSDAFQEEMGTQWEQFSKASEKDLPILVGAMAEDFMEENNVTVDELCKEIIRRKNYLEDPKRADLKHDELCSFTGKMIFQSKFKHKNFKITQLDTPKQLSPYISDVIRVDRLREVRVLKSFTRIHQAASPSEAGNAEFGEISSERKQWLPAVENKGEGIFFSLNDKKIADWASQNAVQNRAKEIDRVLEEDWKAFDTDEERPIKVTPKFLLIHTLAHMIMKQISLESGYDTASIRERIYCDTGKEENNGILLYTSSSDSEGTLGGLSRMAEEDKFLPLIMKAIASAAWCSSDPLCIKDIISESERYNLSACHNCCLVPETSCEFFNRYLDRALLVGTPDKTFKGFFEEILTHAS